MNDTGTIHITEYRNVLGKTERLEYKWVGRPVAYITYMLFDDLLPNVNPNDKEFSIGPYRVRVLEMRIHNDWIKVVRRDYPLWWVIVAWHRINRLLDIAYHRIIITLSVWGLASYDQSRIPSWKDIYLVQRIRKLW